MVVRTTEPADVSWEPQGPDDKVQKALGLLPWPSCAWEGCPGWGVPKEHQSPVPSQVYKLLTTADAELPKEIPGASP